MLHPSEKHQKALPIRVFRALWSANKSQFTTTIGQLTTCAFFFAMRSCEYSTVPRKGRTTIITRRDLQFYRNKVLLRHTDPNLYEKATTVSVTFRDQKNKQKMIMVTQHKNNTELCPVRALTAINNRILSYKGTGLDSQINTIDYNGKLRCIHSTEVFAQIRHVVRGFGQDDLGFTHKEVGTHPIRSSAAMQLFLNKIPIFQIMLLGRWSSDAFLRYILRQVQEFSSGLSAAMVHKDFYTVPEIEVMDPNDPCIRNTGSFASSQASGNST